LNTAPSTDSRLASLPARLPPPDIDPSDLDLDALKVIARLRRHGYAAYLVGGCVRDLMVGAHPKDYDVATSAHPDEIRAIFRHQCRLIGRRFRLAHIAFPGGRFVEVATFRATPVQATEEASTEETTDLLVTDDNQYGTAEEDALRRDFTVNGLFYDVVPGRTLDYVGGREDLAARRIRTIGDADIRLREDPVRGLRAARIAAKLGFSLDPALRTAMQRHADELPRCAPARVLDETLKLLRSGAAATALGLLRETGLLRVLLPPVDAVLEAGDDALRTSFGRRLEALDALVKEGAAVTEAVMLGAVLSFLPLAPEEDDEPAAEVSPRRRGPRVPTADEVLARMAQNARLPRRIADRTRAILAAQGSFFASPKRKRRRGGSGAGIIKAPHFDEALLLLELEVRSTGEHADVLAKWRLKAAEEAAREAGEELGGPAAAASADDEGPVETPQAEASPDAPAGDAPAKKKRRRRGGRGRKKAAEAGPGDGGSTPD
jgi:poly(A) polymerase